MTTSEMENLRTSLADMKARLAVLELKRTYGEYFWLNYEYWEDVVLHAAVYPFVAPFGSAR